MGSIEFFLAVGFFAAVFLGLRSAMGFS